MSQSHKVQPIPRDKGSVTPYIVVKGAAQCIDFLKAAFDAVEQRSRVQRGWNDRTRRSLDREQDRDAKKMYGGVTKISQKLLRQLVRELFLRVLVLLQ